MQFAIMPCNYKLQWANFFFKISHNVLKMSDIKGDLQTIFRFSYLKVHKLITMGMKFKNL